MYTILMNSDKSLSATVRTTLYQRENLVDKIVFILPATYEDLNLSDFTVVLKYLMPTNVARSVVLTTDGELYKENYYKYSLPVGIKLTEAAGDLTMSLSILNANVEESQNEVLHTSTITVPIAPLEDIYAFTDAESFEVIDQKMLQLDAKLKAATILAESIDQNKADDLSFEDNTLQLMANGKKIGTPQKLDTEMDAVDIDEKESQDGDFEVVSF